MRHPLDILRDAQQYIPAGRPDLAAEVADLIAGQQRLGGKRDPLGLTTTERVIYDLLAECAPLPVARHALIDALSTGTRRASEQAIEVHRCRLNRKLVKRAIGEIRSVRGYGYVFIAKENLS